MATDFDRQVTALSALASAMAHSHSPAQSSHNFHRVALAASISRMVVQLYASSPPFRQRQFGSLKEGKPSLWRLVELRGSIAGAKRFVPWEPRQSECRERAKTRIRYMWLESGDPTGPGKGQMGTDEPSDENEASRPDSFA